MDSETIADTTVGNTRVMLVDQGAPHGFYISTVRDDDTLNGTYVHTANADRARRLYVEAVELLLM